MINHDFDIHVVNNIIKQYFIKKQNCIDKFTVISNNKFLFIKIYDKMNIEVNTLIEKSNIQFLNVIYVSNFIINIVAENIFKNKEFHFDTQHRHLHWNDFIVVYVFRIKDHYVFENNKEFEKVITFATFIWADFIHDWRQFLAHVNNKIIQHLITIVKEVKFIDKKSISKINKCETCTFIKST